MCVCFWILFSLFEKEYHLTSLVNHPRRKKEKKERESEEERRRRKKSGKKTKDDDLIKKKKKQKKETQLFVHAPRKSTECARHTWRGVLSSFRKNAVLLSPTRETDGDGEREREREREKRTHPRT